MGIIFSKTGLTIINGMEFLVTSALGFDEAHITEKFHLLILL